MNSQFQQNIDAVLARIVDPLQKTFSIEDAKLVVDRVAPMTGKSLRLPLISTLDLTSARYTGNRSSWPRLAVEHERHDESGFHSGHVKIVNIGNDPELMPFYKFYYIQTKNPDFFGLATWLETDHVYQRSRINQRFDKVHYGVPLKKPDQQSIGGDMATVLAKLYGNPSMLRSVEARKRAATPALA